MKVSLIIILIYLFSSHSWSQQGDPNLSGPAQQGAPVGVGQVPPEENAEQLENEILSHLEPYIYDAEGRRDPFTPFKIFVETPIVEDQIITQEQAPTEAVVQTPETRPLLRYNLSQLNLKAILWNVKKPKIIINDPSNKIHVLSKNDRIGNNSGYIAAIREGEVVVVQKVIVQGKEIVSTKYLRLKR